MIRITRRNALLFTGSGLGSNFVTRSLWAGLHETITNKLPEYVTLEQFGAKGDGVSDDSTALEKAADTGVEIHLKKNRIYHIAVAKIITKDLRIIGDGTLVFSTKGKTALMCKGRVYMKEITLDGNNIANELVRATGSEFKMIGGAVRNVFSSASKYNITGIQLIDCSYVEICEVRFTSICGPGNGVIGDSIGAIAAIQITGYCNYGIIRSCIFSDVNNRNHIGEKSFLEDADAIRCYSTTGDQNIKVSGNMFSDIGKRAAKFLGTEKSIYSFENNEISSKYIKTIDNRLTYGNGMYSIVSCYSGYFTAKSNKLSSGVVGYFFEGGTLKLRSVELIDNIFEPEFHRIVNTSVTRFSYIGNILSIDFHFSEFGNRVENTYQSSVVLNK